MAAVVVTALQGEPLDALVWRVLGTDDVEPVLAANRGVAELGPFLPEGTRVLLPADVTSATPSEVELVKLWD